MELESRLGSSDTEGIFWSERPELHYYVAWDDRDIVVRVEG